METVPYLLPRHQPFAIPGKQPAQKKLQSSPGQTSLPAWDKDGIHLGLRAGPHNRAAVSGTALTEEGEGHTPSLQAWPHLAAWLGAPRAWDLGSESADRRAYTASRLRQLGNPRNTSVFPASLFQQLTIRLSGRKDAKMISAIL